MMADAKYILYAQCRWLGRLHFDGLLGLAMKKTSSHLQAPEQKVEHEQECMYYHYQHVVFTTNRGWGNYYKDLTRLSSFDFKYDF